MADVEVEIERDDNEVVELAVDTDVEELIVTRMRLVLESPSSSRARFNEYPDIARSAVVELEHQQTQQEQEQV
jgi:hypothetical protein